MAPRRHRRRHSEGETGFSQQPPGPLVTASSQIQIRAEDDQVVGKGRQQMASLERSTRRSEPLVSRRSSGVEMCTHEAESVTAKVYGGGYRNPALQHQWQLDRLGIVQWER